MKHNLQTGALEATVAGLTNSFFVAPAVEGFGSLWTSTAADGIVWRIDPADGAVQAKVAIPGGLDKGAATPAGGPALDATGVWIVAGGPSRQLVHVDQATPTPVRALPPS